MQHKFRTTCDDIGINYTLSHSYILFLKMVPCHDPLLAPPVASLPLPYILVLYGSYTAYLTPLILYEYNSTQYPYQHLRKS